MFCCDRGSRGVQNNYVIFIMNSFLLCICYLLYTLGWIGRTSNCGQTGTFVSYIAATSAAFNGILSLVSFALFCFLLTRAERHTRGFAVILIICSCTSLVYAVITSTTMFASLYVKFNPACLDSRRAKGDMLYISVVAAYHMISYLVILLICILSMDVVQPSREILTEERSPDVVASSKGRDTMVTFIE
ncbi:hypothetical protein ANCCAN_17518 [Ancylostoma caninum]|uniref:Uncharacterized protein n=1 Tax=Ancylostoma caninum TaxID=29170 RepID=A0A368FWM3_ANCCA|nr:hypothetical protein ANCCAN_17518 [Ancylostoma caninum]